MDGDNDDDEGGSAARFSNPHDTLELAGLAADLAGGDDPAPLVATATGAGGSSSSAGGAHAVAPGAAIKDLRAEKRQLQQYLRAYEREFEEREGRKVKYVKDISPVVNEYTRYKHIKAILRELAP